MTTEQDYATISDWAYRADPLKQDPPLAIDTKFYTDKDKTKQFQVVWPPASDTSSGFQGIAVAPVDSSGVPDLSQIVIGFAGTNIEDHGDLLADVESVVGQTGDTGAQIAAAKAYAREVRDRFPGPSLSVTGHSLGGFLALDVGAEFGWDTVAFNGPDPWESLSPEARTWLLEQRARGRKPLKNLVNELDVIGNVAGNGTGAAVYVADAAGRDLMTYHDLGTGFRFDPDGTVVGAGATGRTAKELAWNILSGLPPETALRMQPLVVGLLGVMRNPLAARYTSLQLSGGMVMVETVAATALAVSFSGLLPDLESLRSANAGLVAGMDEHRRQARTAAALYPFVTETDIENCFDMHRLHTRQNIDTDAVDQVDALLRDHLKTVALLSEGVLRVVQHAQAHDVQWAQIYNG